MSTRTANAKRKRVAKGRWRGPESARPRSRRAGNRTLLRHGETGAENLSYYGYDAANELTTVHDQGGWSYFYYDQNGNTVTEQTPSYTRYYDWDGRDMLAGVRSTEAGWTDNVYRYDGLASRVSTLESSGFTYYDWDAINVLQEKDGSGNVTSRQVHGYAPILSVGDIALMDVAGSPYVLLADQVGTTSNLLDSTGVKANSYTYDAFGVGRSVTETVPNRYRFWSKRLDADLAFYLTNAGPYAPRHGRYTAAYSGLFARANAVSGQPTRPTGAPTQKDVNVPDHYEAEPFGFLDQGHRFYTYSLVKPAQATWDQVNRWNRRDLYAFMTDRSGPFSYDSEIAKVRALVDRLSAQAWKTRCAFSFYPHATEPLFKMVKADDCLYLAAYGHGTWTPGKLPGTGTGQLLVFPWVTLATSEYDSDPVHFCLVSCGRIPPCTSIAEGYAKLEFCIWKLFVNCKATCPPGRFCTIYVSGGPHYSYWGTPWVRDPRIVQVWDAWWNQNPSGWPGGTAPGGR